MSRDPHSPQPGPPSGPPPSSPPPGREYEKSGCYPENARPFRIWALIGGLTLVVILLGLVSALLNFLLI